MGRLTRSRRGRRGRRGGRMALLTASVIGLTVLSALGASANTERRRARSADRFVNSIGVNVHLHYTDTVYSRFDTLVEPRLLELGVRHIRDGAYTYKGASSSTFYYRRLRDLGKRGIRASLITTFATGTTARTDISKLDDIQRWTNGAVESFEGVNEPDINRGKDWVAKTRRLQRDVWNKVQKASALRRVDVLAPSPAFHPGALGDVSAWSDYGNWHAYPGGKCPGCRGAYGSSFDARADAYRSPARGRPLVISETGYHNAVAGEQSHPPVSERAAGKYLPRLLFQNFNRGIARSYIYELLDLRPNPNLRKRDLHFGLLRNDGSRKPAFRALRNLIAVLEDPGPRFSPSSLKFGLTGATGNVQHTLLQKRDGRFYLALWQQRSSYATGERAHGTGDIRTQGDLHVARKRLTVRTGARVRAKLYVPSAGTRARRSWSATKAVTLKVPDEVVLLQLTPARR